MKNYDIINHVRGESLFIDDINIPDGILYASVFYSHIAHGKVIRLDLEEALSSPGVKDILTYKDIPGENQIGGIILDEPLLAEDHVHYIGMPIALVIAEDEIMARNAVKKIKTEIKPLQSLAVGSYRR